MNVHQGQRPEYDFAPVDVVPAAELAGVPVPSRAWIVPDLIPSSTVTILSGDGGTGKSLLSAQLAVAVATAHEWLGREVKPGPVVFVSAEDDLDEIHRRLADIAASQGLDLADLGDLYIVPLAGRDAVMGAPEGRSGIINKTPLWDGFEKLVVSLQPVLVVLDNLADVFAGNEIARSEARQFVGILRGLAIDNGLAVVLLSHPSLTGINSGTGASGSTAWNNSVRSRLYLDRVLERDEVETDQNMQVLRTMKANYAATGGEIQLRWSEGVFVIEGAPVDFSLAMAAASGRALIEQDREFLDKLKAYIASGRTISPAAAPKTLAKGGQGRRASIKANERTLERLFAAGIIRAEIHGAPSRGTRKIVICRHA